MKKILIAVLLLSCFDCPAQSTSTVGSGVAGSLPPTGRMEVYSWASRPDEDETDLQQKFVKQEWTAGHVKFRSGRPDMQVKMIFDIYDNTPYYLQDSLIMEFVDSVSELNFAARFNKDTVHMKFRRFYPAIQANTSATFYQVLVDARIELLKCKAKSILLFKDPAIPEEKKKDPEQLYFASLPGNKIIQVAPDADVLLKNLPEYSAQISAIMKREKIKPKDEHRLIQLFIHLNNELH